MFDDDLDVGKYAQIKCLLFEEQLYNGVAYISSGPSIESASCILLHLSSSALFPRSSGPPSEQPFNSVSSPPSDSPEHSATLRNTRRLFNSYPLRRFELPASNPRSGSTDRKPNSWTPRGHDIYSVLLSYTKELDSPWFPSTFTVQKRAARKLSLTSPLMFQRRNLVRPCPTVRGSCTRNRHVLPEIEAGVRSLTLYRTGLNRWWWGGGGCRVSTLKQQCDRL
ncbi:uncharacterized protein LOC127618973 [Xyrauchen texanus]|uniref:uncharacterized protein LOC127618973 n=1 Tax=Xyrauchen texanus TaxID=154827 RepID=UPI002241C6D9|nr:uncharacterized protein LOC127618973 [Xyrauchen texanus]